MTASIERGAPGAWAETCGRKPAVSVDSRRGRFGAVAASLER